MVNLAANDKQNSVRRQARRHGLYVTQGDVLKGLYRALRPYAIDGNFGNAKFVEGRNDLEWTGQIKNVRIGQNQESGVLQNVSFFLNDSNVRFFALFV